MRIQTNQDGVSHVLLNEPTNDTAPSKGGVRVSILAVVLCVLAVFGLGVDYLLQPQRFPMKHINVKGELVNTHPAQIQRAIAQVVSSSNILRVDVSKAVAAAQALPWVENATVNRKWPDTLEVRVNERVVHARWNDDRWLDQKGVMLTLPDFNGDDSLPQLRGAAGSEKEVLARYRMFDKKFQHYGLKVLEIEKSERGSWDVQLQVVKSVIEQQTDSDSDSSAEEVFNVVLGSDDSYNKAERFLQLYSELFRDVADQIEVVDMRYPDGASVRWLKKTPKFESVTELKNS